MAKIISGRLGRFMFEVYNKSTGEKEMEEQSGTSRYDAWNILTKKRGSNFEIKWDK